MQTEFHQYVRDNKGQKVGVLYAGLGFLPAGPSRPLDSAQGLVYVGWSTCHRLDRFDPKRGLQTAKVRAYRREVTVMDVLDILDGDGFYGADIPAKILHAVEPFLVRIVSHYRQLDWQSLPTMSYGNVEVERLARKLVDVAAARKVEGLFPREKGGS